MRSRQLSQAHFPGIDFGQPATHASDFVRHACQSTSDDNSLVNDSPQHLFNYHERQNDR